MDFALELVARIRASFEQHRDPVSAKRMSAYMRNMFPFAGISSPQRRVLTAQALSGIPRPVQADIAASAEALWQLPEREYQYAATDLVTRYVRVCGADFLENLRSLITTKSWWDTVDALASTAVGPLISASPPLVSEMDRWIESESIWLARSAILFQLRYRSGTDPDRLFCYCLKRASETEFFIRKAIGWALREYSKTDAAAVRQFVAQHPTELSPLSQREALLWLNGGRSGNVERAIARA